MPTRYEKETPSWVYEILEEIRGNHHEDLKDASFYIWFDTQKRMAGGHITLGSISKANAKTRTLAGDQYDYEVILDAEVFKNLNGAQQRHLIHWLLCHCQVTTEDEEPQFGLKAPDYPLYAAEMTFNSHWRQTWDDMRNLAAQVHAGKTGVPTNDPDNPNMFGDGAPDPNGGEDGDDLPKCPYREVRAEKCGACAEADDCGGACFQCDQQAPEVIGGAMPEGCASRFKPAGSPDAEAA